MEQKISLEDIPKVSYNDPIIKNLFVEILKGFNGELNKLCSSSFYGFNDKPDRVFMLIERTYIGLISNAIAFNFKNYPIMQEFVVWKDGEVDIVRDLKEKRFFGRADFMINDIDNNYLFLFEAKLSECPKSRKNENTIKGYFKKCFEQADRYYEQFKNINSKKYKVAIIFEWIRDYNNPNVKYITEIIKKTSDFFGLYKTDKSGMMVYGKIEEYTE